MNKSPTLLIIEDDLNFAETLEVEFQERGYLVTKAHSSEMVRSLFGKIDFQFITLDLRLNEDWGLHLVADLRLNWPSARLVVLTGFGSIPTAVESIKRGANQYLTKPVSMDILERTLWSDQPLNDESVQIETLAAKEREYLEWVLLQCNQNISEAARRLGLHRQSLQRMLKKYSL